MRRCRNCSHENADHLSYCSQCGRRLVSGALRALGGSPDGSSYAGGTAAFSPTMMVKTPARTGLATVTGGRRPRTKTIPDAPMAAGRSGLGWFGDSIGYIYVFLRGKLDAEERRRRLLDERAGAKALLSGAINTLGLDVLREGIQNPDITGLLEAIGRAHARRESAAADMASSETLQQAEATRLGAQEAAAQAEWSAADKATHEAEEILRATTSDRQAVANRLARVKDDRARNARNEAASTGGAARSAQLAHEGAGLASEQRALEEQAERLDRQLADLRPKAAGLRATAGTAKAKHEQAVAARRQAASNMAASIAGRLRDRATAEREVADLTEQLGRVTAEARFPHSALLSSYQNIDRLNETIADRGAQLAALEQSRGHYDGRKLLTGVGLVTSMLLATAAALWAVLR
jgi:hypothetical protein